ncbi:MAG: transporter substrate-binding domain-containing protein [Clostridia bacterium]|nr:transporter substrate-binding domain-containing protein [Clostridia bacterium]
MLDTKLWELLIDSFPKMLLPGLTVTMPLTLISFTLALIIATVNAEVTFYDYLASRPDADIKIATLDSEATSVGIPMPKGENSASLVEAVNKALNDLAESGKLKELSEKYFGTDISSNK